jgi:hypothetical protein
MSCRGFIDGGVIHLLPYIDLVGDERMLMLGWLCFNVMIWWGGDV